MIKGLKTQGFTIVETMIVLAVSGLLLVAAMVTISGQQGKTQFSQAINDIQAQINDVINNVATGYYASKGNVKCIKNGTGFTLSSASVPEGTNQDCTFMGRAIQFAVEGNPDNYNIYDIVGLRTNSNGQPVQTLAEAVPLALAPPNGADTTQQQQLEYGLTPADMYYTDAGTSPKISTVAFLSTLPALSRGNLVSGSQQVELRPVQNTANLAVSGGDKSAAGAIGKINAAGLSVIPSGGVTICFNSGGSNQYGTITIGGNGRQLTTTLNISSGSCP